MASLYGFGSYTLLFVLVNDIIFFAGVLMSPSTSAILLILVPSGFWMLFISAVNDSALAFAAIFCV